jgi:riboflavin biosynthesis pyrimidine reductase
MWTARQWLIDGSLMAMEAPHSGDRELVKPDIIAFPSSLAPLSPHEGAEQRLDARQFGRLLEYEIANPDSAPKGVSTNFVVSLDGRITLDGRSGKMAGPADHNVFQLLRAACDVIVVGAATAEAEHYGHPAVPSDAATLRTAVGLSAQPRLVLASNSGNVDPSQLRLGALRRRTGAAHDSAAISTEPATGDEPAPIMLAVPAAIANATADRYPMFEVIAAGEDEVDPRRLVETLEHLGMARINCEGGPRLFQSFFRAGVIAAMNFTISPRLVGSSGDLLVDATSDTVTATGWKPDRWGLEHLAQIDGDIYVRYRPC